MGTKINKASIRKGARLASLKKHFPVQDGFLLILCFLPYLQLPFLANDVYAPHAWRQMDTLGYAYDFYSQGTSIFKPQVYWMGSHKTLLLEFPITEYIQAIFFKVFGYSIKLGQFLNLAFFSFCLAFFYKLLKQLFSKGIAIYSALSFLFLPLVFYYSHTFLVDFFALGCGFAMCFYFIKGIKSEKWHYWLYAALFAALSFLVKAPTSFYFFLPLAVITIQQKKWKFVLQYSWLFILALVPFYFWVRHSVEMNALAPNLKPIISDYRKFDDNTMWYFGLWEHRYIPYSWYTLWYRFSQELTGGIFILFLSLCGLAFTVISKQKCFVLAWLLGLFGMLLTFFNLNVIHNYYQLPFMPILALGLGYLLYQINRWDGRFKQLVSVVFFIIMIAHSYHELKASYFQKTEFMELGSYLEKNSDPKDIVITSYGGLSAQCPLILSSAHRHGYSISNGNLNSKLIIELMDYDANKFFYVTKAEPGGELRQFMEFFKYKKQRLNNGLFVFLVDLKTTHTGEPYNPKAFD